MATLQFTNASSGNTSLYLAEEDNNWCAYLLANSVTGPASGAIGLDELYKYKGYILFSLAAPNIAIDTFVSNVYTFLGNLIEYQWASVVWFANPNTTLNSNNTSQIILSGGNNGPYSVLSGFNYNFGNNFATLFISNNFVTLTVDSINNAMIISSQQGSTNYTFRPNNLSSSSQIMKNIEIPLTGVGQGHIRFIMGFNAASDFTGFNVSNNYGFNNNVNNGALTAVNYSLIEAGNLNDLILMQVSIYPCDLLNKAGTNSYFAFLGQTQNTHTGNSTISALSSYYLTNFGYPLVLVPYTNFIDYEISLNYPTQDSSLLVFSEQTPNDPLTIWYMTPQGAFSLTLSTVYEKNVDTSKQIQLMCGLGSTETVSFTPQFIDDNDIISGTGDWLYYQTNQNAFAPQFPIQATQNVVGSNTTQEWLNANYLSAWNGIVMANNDSTPVVYHAQAQGAALFAPDTDATSPLFTHLTTGSGVLSAAKETIFFPLVPYGLVAATPSTLVDFSLFEKQIINPTRKAIIAAVMSAEKIPASPTTLLTARTANGNNIPSTSPQGFYIDVNPQNGVWETLQLASNQFLTAEGSLSKIFNLQFTPASSTLQSALQSNQLFLVISYNEKLSDGTYVLSNFSSEMEIAEWPFLLNVPTEQVNGQYKNVVIFKFCTGKLIDKVQNIQGWNSPYSFNDTSNNGLPNLSMWLQQYVQNGMDKYIIQKDTDYANFYNIATNPDWQGIITLGVDISVQDFPKELQGLLAGIDLNSFYAHHFGIDISIVNNVNGAVSMQPTSSMFALIDYQDPTFEGMGSNPAIYKTNAPINGSVDYDFIVLQLKIVFINSKIYNYNSYLALTVNNLFGEKVNASNRDNLIILTGTYENNNGVPSYAFTNTEDNVLNLVNSSIITDVEIIKTAFVTVVAQNDVTSNTVNSKFSFWGFINYTDLSFDLLSFGAEPDSKITNYRGLSYSNLYIDLTFQLETPTTKTFVFDINQMAFDIGQSTPRADSLYAHFPLQLSGITRGDSINTPTTQGYLNVTIPDLQQQQNISGQWYALVFNLNMGTLGSLASSAGFTSTFMAAWGVGATGAWAGVKLPGVNPQAPSFSLQGVLKLNIGSILMQRATETNGTAYLMKINNIALELFSLSFPPGGNICFMLFGNPATDAKPESLGWYGSYVKS
ncbi:hypothetical protein [Flavobacterium frigoris]|uniref:Uncharacterized protein n=1 Tax=Flavobacterium frigoris TaxID=229204 RepID=A0A1H9H8N6_FLAFI|nr:hypothetical protein [Flavobacterium frigoris]SEQ58729.1 hypothetical protein SAMN05444355_10361 [Flavobacterium frigoris]